MTSATFVKPQHRHLAAGLVLLLLLAGVVPAAACMDGMMRSMTFMKHPQAKRVFLAAAQSSKVALPRSVTRQAHMLSLIQTKRTVAALQARYRSAPASRDQSLMVSVLLAEEAFNATLSDRSPQEKRVGGYSGIDIYSTASAFRSILEGHLSWEDALADDLVVLAGPADRRDVIADRMRRVLMTVE